jgi:hypothetical protein
MTPSSSDFRHENTSGEENRSSCDPLLPVHLLHELVKLDNDSVFSRFWIAATTSVCWRRLYARAPFWEMIVCHELARFCVFHKPLFATFAVRQLDEPVAFKFRCLHFRLRADGPSRSCRWSVRGMRKALLLVSPHIAILWRLSHLVKPHQLARTRTKFMLIPITCLLDFLPALALQLDSPASDPEPSRARDDSPQSLLEDRDIGVDRGWLFGMSTRRREAEVRFCLELDLSMLFADMPRAISSCRRLTFQNAMFTNRRYGFLMQFLTSLMSLTIPPN